MNKSKIEWCDRTWNPVTGCLHGCKYCFARKNAQRFAKAPKVNKKMEQIFAQEFGEPTPSNIHMLENPIYVSGKRDPYPFAFEPTFYKYRLDEPQHAKKPQAIFVVDMGDLFGEWVPYEWIQEVFKACEAAPWHTYLFLTKSPKDYDRICFPKPNPEFHDRLWFGATINEAGNDSAKRQSDLYWKAPNNNLFLSIEPLMGFTVLFDVFRYKQVIIGAETGNRKGQIIPKPEWIKAIVDQCKDAGVPVFLKDNIRAIYEPVYGAAPRELAWEVHK